MGRVPTVIVAGGRATRMGGREKPLLALGRGTILSSILDRLGPDAAPVAVNTNGDPLSYAPLPVLPDPPLPEGVEAQPGPLAGILAACRWAAAHGASRVLTVPGDAPFLPRDLLARLAAVPGAEAPVVAAEGGRLHPVAALWPVALAPRIREALAAGERRVGVVAQALGARTVEFGGDARGAPGAFLNVNAPEDLARARAFARTLARA